MLDTCFIFISCKEPILHPVEPNMCKNARSRFDLQFCNIFCKSAVDQASCPDFFVPAGTIRRIFLKFRFLSFIEKNRSKEAILAGIELGDSRFLRYIR